jgi:hypothetical protein
MCALIKHLLPQVEKFIHITESKSFYGLQKETLDSLVLNFLPALGHKYESVQEDRLVVDTTKGVNTFLLQTILIVLRENAGFYIPKVNIPRN